MTEARLVRALEMSDLPGAQALSASAHWNQNEADWRCMLALGQGWGIDAVAGNGLRVLAASTMMLPYGRSFAWLSMVLVLPEFRRLGYANLLLRHALAVLQQQGRSAVLDATPAGHAVYVQHGFVDTWSFARYGLVGRPVATVPPPEQKFTRPLQQRDWPAIAALDEPAFGASRLPLLHHLAQRQPQAAQVLESDGHINGYVLARDGLGATQIGPLVAANEQAAAALLMAALESIEGPVYADVLDQRSGLQACLRARGFEAQRAFTRMVHGRKKAPGDAGAVMLVAGPELG